MGFSNLGLFKPLLINAASSATRDDRTDASICAEDVEAVSFAATAAAVAFLLSSSLIVGFTDEVERWEGGVTVGLFVGWAGGKRGSIITWFILGGIEEIEVSWSFLLAACSI